MLNKENMLKELQKYNFTYEKNILCGHTKSKVKWVLPAGAINVIAFEQASSYLFGFTSEGINIFPVDSNWQIKENLSLPWEQIIDFKIKKGILLENEMKIQTNDMKIEMKINKFIANNPWVKENINYLESKNYFYNKNID